MFRINCFEICITSQNFVEPFISPKTLKVFKKKQNQRRNTRPDLPVAHARPDLPWPTQTYPAMDGCSSSHAASISATDMVSPHINFWLPSFNQV